MTTEPSLALRAIQLAVAAHECRVAAAEHPPASRALLAAGDSYSGQASELLGAIADLADKMHERMRRRLKAN